jgi:hypothetical protein
MTGRDDKYIHLFENLKGRAQAYITREIQKLRNSAISTVLEAHKGPHGSGN